MDEYDRRQLERMRSQLASYAAGELDLRMLIADLEALLSLLTGIDENWRERFREQWGVLEQVYSGAAALDQPLDSEESRALIAAALAQLHALLDEVLV